MTKHYFAQSKNNGLKIIKLCLLLFLISTAMVGCKNSMEDNNEYESLESRTYNSTPENSHNDLLNSAIYHDETKSWLVPFNDPYTLENCQKAYDNIVQNISPNAINSSEFTASTKLEATHYALKIFPRTEDEQWQISNIDGIKVSYQPFNYTSIYDDSQINYLVNSRSDQMHKVGNSKYSETYSNFKNSEGSVDPVTYNMPILYVVWPAGKQLPSEYDYEMLYHVFLPFTDEIENNTLSASSRKKSLSYNALKLLDQEAKAIAFAGTNFDNKTSLRSAMPVLAAGFINSYDNYLKKFAPLHNMVIRLQLGTFIKDIIAGSDGRYFYREYLDRNTNMTLIFEKPNYKICNMGYTSPINLYLGTLGSRSDNSAMDINITWAGLGGSFACETFRAANYYYNGPSHKIPITCHSGGMRIEVTNQIHPQNIQGSFNYTSNSKPYIIVYANAASPVGTTLHEFGHFVNYQKRGYSNYVNIERLIKESYASYVGWHVGKTYYWSQGYNSSSDPTLQARQSWYGIGDYSPIFVDLIDTHNQLTTGNSVIDFISNVPHSVIDRIINESNNISRCKQIMQEYVNVYYNQTDLDNLLYLY